MRPSSVLDVLRPFADHANVSCIQSDAESDAQLMRRITVTIDADLEVALAEAPRRLELPESASDSEKLRAYARRGYEEALATELDAARVATYRAWADEPEMGVVPKAALRRAARHGVFDDE